MKKKMIYASMWGLGVFDRGIYFAWILLIDWSTSPVGTSNGKRGFDGMVTRLEL